jgi:anti-sigma regulatory factor (Ser/Thr protein kinase)
LPAAVEISIEATPTAAELARSVLHATYADSLPAVSLQDLKAIVSELVANSWRHGPGGPIKVAIAPKGDAVLRGEVDDHGYEAFGMVEIGDDAGLGLHIVDALADDWEVDETGGVVRFTLAA